jgi:hypothetical protein
LLADFCLNQSSPDVAILKAARRQLAESALTLRYAGLVAAASF